MVVFIWENACKGWDKTLGAPGKGVLHRPNWWGCPVVFDEMRDPREERQTRLIKKVTNYFEQAKVNYTNYFEKKSFLMAIFRIINCNRGWARIKNAVLNKINRMSRGEGKPNHIPQRLTRHYWYLKQSRWEWWCKDWFGIDRAHKFFGSHSFLTVLQVVSNVGDRDDQLPGHLQANVVMQRGGQSAWT